MPNVNVTLQPCDMDYNTFLSDTTGSQFRVVKERKDFPYSQNQGLRDLAPLQTDPCHLAMTHQTDSSSPNSLPGGWRDECPPSHPLHEP